jgi:hypothetical protein
VPVRSHMGPSAFSTLCTPLTSTLRGFLPGTLLAAGASVGNADVADVGSDSAAVMVRP